ncbi:Sorbin and SH3 domain-containing protein 1 [Dirofilaria immitis]|nr:Sorbin and SH3 domain-containing protein 1 [Dirofilaria immitis]
MSIKVLYEYNEWQKLLLLRIPSASPTLQKNFDRFSGLINEFGHPERANTPQTIPQFEITTCIALFSFKAVSPKELSFNRGDVIRVHRVIDINWMEGEHNGQIGIFLLHMYNNATAIPDRPKTPHTSTTPFSYRVLYAYKPRNADELELEENDIVFVVEKCDDGWFIGTLNTVFGIQTSYARTLQVLHHEQFLRAFNEKMLSEETSSSEPENVVPLSLEGLGYHFDGHGVMRDKVFFEWQKYEFTDQKSYEKIGLAVTEEIYRIMESPPYNMERQYVFKDWYKKENLIVLIHGSGAVRAGQWSRRLIMNESLNIGSQLPYLRICKSRDWGVVVMNTNMNITDNVPLEPLPESRTPLEHGITVWERYVAKAKANSVAVVAHSAGGAVIAGIIENYWSTEWMKRLKCVCLTDAVFTLPSVTVMDWLPAIRNWRATPHTEVGLRIDNSMLYGEDPYVTYISAGTNQHEETSAVAIEDIFDLLTITLCLNMLKPGELVTDWMQAERLCSYLEIGDLIEFRRVVGNIKRRIYTHWGVFIGFHDKKAYIAHTGTDFGDFDDNLISSSVESMATIGKKCHIRRDELITVANGDSCRVNNSLDKGKRPFPPVIVVDRALRMLGKTNYNLLLNNCEHFAKYCRYGLKESNQATVAKIIIISSATYCITGSLAVSAVVGTLTYTFSRLGRNIKKLVPSYPDVLL